MGLRLIETVQEFPSPHSEELQRFAQVSFGVETSLEKRKWEFTRWVLQNGFADINNAVKTALQRLFVFKTIELRLLNGEAFDVKQFEEELRRKVNEFHHPHPRGEDQLTISRALTVPKGIAVISQRP